MTNDELQDLTNMARDVVQNLTPFMLGGDGRFYSLSGDIITPAEVLEWHYRASKRAVELHDALRNVPRRKLPVKV